MEQQALAYSGGERGAEPPDGVDFRAFLEQLAERLLRRYIDRVRLRTRPPARKEINDSVWQTIIIHPFEVIILDSPLLQRLRHIRQLGVAHMVYPGAAHTRLDHSVGTMHQMQQLLDAINASSPNPIILEPLVRLMRFTALCHDLGHGVMSHVSENAIRGNREVNDIEFDFAATVDVERAKLSEIATYHLLGSPAFLDLIAVARTLVPDHVLPADATVLAQKAVVGKPISDEIPLLNELISGPFDADKLDYMTRDAHMAGVPIVTDIARLVRKIRAVEVPPDGLPNDIARAVQPRPSYKVTGVALSGGRTLDELMLGRTLLFDKIYRHQKVRAAEAMVAAIIHAIQQATKLASISIPYLLMDEELLHLDECKLRALGADLSDSTVKHWADLAISLASDLCNRTLFVRAFAFAQAMPLDPQRHESGQRSGLERLVREARDRSSRQKIVQAIIIELKSILHHLGKDDLLASPLAESMIVLDPPATTAVGGDIPRAYLITASGHLTRFREDAAEARGWADAYLLTRDVGYVFCPEALAPYVFLSCQAVVGDKYGVQIPLSMQAYAKQDPKDLDNLRQELKQKQYYAAKAHDLRPLPDRLTKADVKALVGQILKNIHGYQGPIPLGQTVSNSCVDETRIINWLRQFEDDKVVGEAMEMLSQIKLFGRDTIVGALKQFVEDHPDFKGAIVCPLGAIKDSAAIVTYYARDLIPSLPLQTMSLSDALATTSPERPIIFLDDFVGSGSQSISIVESWLGAEPTTDLGEERNETLPEHSIDQLRARKLAFVFGATMQDGLNHIKSRCLELGLSRVETYAHWAPTDLPRAFDQGKLAGLKAACERIGSQLVTDVGEETKRRERILGYGNQALLVLFPYNTPTQSLTCLWKAGIVNGVPWAPLFPRRKKT